MAKPRTQAPDENRDEFADSTPPTIPGQNGFAPFELDEESAKIRIILDNEDYAGGNFEISRRNDSGKWGFLTTLAISDWSEDAKVMIGREYGGGEYLARVRSAAGLRGASFKFYIDKAVKPVGAAASEKQVDMLDLMRQAKSITGDSTAIMLQMMQQSNQTQMQFMQMLMKQQSDSMSAMVALMGNRPNQGGDSGNSKVVEMLLQHALKPQAPAPVMDFDKMMDFVGKMKALTEKPSDSSGDDDLFGGILKSLPSLIQSFARIQLPQPVQQIEAGDPEPARVATRPVSNPVQEQPTAPDRTDDALNGMRPADIAKVNRDALGVFLPQLVTHAAAGASPQDVAEMVSGVMDDEQFSAVIELLRRADWLGILGDVHQPIMAHSNWFIKLRDCLFDLAAEPAEDEIDIDTVREPADS